MDEKIDDIDLQKLRDKAEKQIREQGGKEVKIPAEKLQTIIHELWVHQIELEMQNESLRRAQEQVEIWRDRFQDLYDCAPVGYLTLSKEGIILEANLTLVNLLGIERSKPIGKPFASYVLKVDQDHYYLEHRQIFGRGESADFELRLNKSNGEIFHARLSCLPLSDASGQHSQCRIAISDISESKQAEAALRASEYNYRALMEQSSDGILVADPSGRYIDVNTAGCALLGYTYYELLQLSMGDLIADAEADEIPLLLDQLRSGKAVLRQRTLARKDGSHLTVEISAKELADGRLLEFIRDSTQRIHTEQRIQRQLERLTALWEIDQVINSTFDMQTSLGALLSRAMTRLAVDAAVVLILDPVRNVLECGAGLGFRSDAGIAASLRLGERFVDEAAMPLADEPSPGLPTNFLNNEDFVSYYGVPLIVKGKVIGVLEVFNRSFMMRDPDWLDFVKTLAEEAAIAIDNARLFENLQRSNTDLERRVIERTTELNRINTELELANRTKDDFLANMSHELRTPLTGILGLTEIMLQEISGTLNAHQKEWLQAIDTSGQHLLELINDVLDVSKIEAGKLEIHLEIVSVKDICGASLFLIKEMAFKRHIELALELDRHIESADLKLRADSRRLKQILVNLLSNGVKFTPENGRVTLKVSVDRDQGQIHFIVTDTGIGIAPKDMNRLFKPFVQLDSSLTRQDEGSGLGLALVLKLAEMHGGSVYVESEVGVGSRFVVTLPWQVLPDMNQKGPDLPHVENSVETAAALEEPTPNSISPEVILLAEDNEINIITIRDCLAGNGYKVAVARNGLDAIAMTGEILPALILMDIHMPGLDGLEATRRLRMDPRFASTPIIALTALAMTGDRELCLEAGANEYMRKPVILRDLLRTIRVLLDQK